MVTRRAFTSLCLLLMTPCLITWSSNVDADTVQSMNEVVGGINIYSPTVMNDGGTYKMWFSGWVDTNQANDKIYYLETTNPNSWSNPSDSNMQIQPSSISSHAVHTGDPSVTKIDCPGNDPLWTIFFTVQLDYCPTNNQSYPQCAQTIWYGLSTDGINWGSFNQVPIPAADSGNSNNEIWPANPSAIVDESDNDETVWKLYFEDRDDPTVIKMVKLNGLQQMIGSLQRVYSAGNFALSPEVRQIGSNWYLWYHTYVGSPLSHADIHEVVSSSNTSWSASNDTVLISNPPNPNGYFCATETPGVIVNSSSSYDLFFALVPSGSSCDLTQNQSIQRWNWSIP